MARLLEIFAIFKMLLHRTWTIVLSRLVPYWLTVIATCWTLTFLYFWNATRAFEWYSAKAMKIFTALGVKDNEAMKWSPLLLGFIIPLLLAASISTLLLTSAPLPVRRLSYLNQMFASVRRFRIMDAEHGVALHKKNQFGVGQPNFDLMAFWLIFLPGILHFCTYIHHTLHHARDPETLPVGVTAHQRSVEYVSDTAGWTGTIVLSLFLIPVSRHSVLLVAMNWSPVHALRIHIWAGYVSFFLIFLHGIMMVGVWFKWAPGAIYEEIIPSTECWMGAYTEESRCMWKFYNFTGVIAMIFYTILWVSSLHWFRRKWYRLFYILHVVCGSLTLLASIWHIQFIGIYLLPSILYYLASTMPTLVQALASRFRGGVQIVQVVALDNAGDCIEVRILMDPTAEANLTNAHPSKFVKLCAPGISAVWHPFTVYSHLNDPTTMRMMIRPIGQFTTKLRSALVDTTKRPVTLIDGFYHGSDHCQQAMIMLDHISIISGGVALTPFLSMIFAILKELRSAQSEPNRRTVALRSMTLIWACRELGLLSFMKQNYLDNMVRLANKVGDFEFRIKIYCTGYDNMEGSALSVKGEEVLTEQPSNHEGLKEKETNASHCNRITSELDAMKTFNHQTIAFTSNMADNSIDAGHAMELGRMMPARCSRMICNVPYFAVFTSSVWIGFYLMFDAYDSIELGTYGDYSNQAYVTMFVIPFFVGVGLITECFVLMLRKYWPASSNNYTTPASTLEDPTDERIVQSDENITALINDSFQYIVGRPNSGDMLADASRASAPGLFVGGPSGMIQALRLAVSVENSPGSFLTRYAIYEESFEL